MTIKIFLVDDHTLVRVGMKMILSNELDLEVIGEAETGEAALPQIRELRPNVVLCDMHLPGVSGLEITEKLVKGNYGSRVIIVSVLEDGPLPKRLLEAGASGYVGKGGDANELLRAIREVALGKRYLGNSIAQNLVLSSLEGGCSPFDVLSPRELEIALLLIQGLSQGAIAKLLCLSPKTINTHKVRLFAKVDVRDTIALARLAIQYGVSTPEKYSLDKTI
ncbi:response regulator [Xylella fastidiosa subsp. morus]|uniref:response regulator n=1 Tax=Xylella fastidiosa TaxID=2371 RepID=UPI0003ED0FD7|nr:response regulator [Xylella fastidiosa]AIC13439.1 response regulator [Xylella fastidiosa MUL0034]EWG14733.1 two component LuxR family transcriptional regulator [Xylella fastidiosa Mul-MD]UIN28937.1 response regulator [Xylella fastidiosa subsp. morus]UIT36587.1 response regulator [Xylella fastidiosa subsp. morus]UIT38880.1 response regulator [Xylella fastidiosa subsp. morus]